MMPLLLYHDNAFGVMHGDASVFTRVSMPRTHSYRGRSSVKNQQLTCARQNAPNFLLYYTFIPNDAIPFVSRECLCRSAKGMVS